MAESLNESSRGSKKIGGQEALSPKTVCPEKHHDLRIQSLTFFKNTGQNLKTVVTAIELETTEVYANRKATKSIPRDGIPENY